MSVLDPTALAASPLSDLHQIASELGIDGYRRLRKADLIDAIVAEGGGGGAPPTAEGGAAPAPRRRRAAPAAAGTDAEEEEAPPRRRRAPAKAAEEAPAPRARRARAAAAEDAEEPAPRRRRAATRAEEEPEVEPVVEEAAATEEGEEERPRRRGRRGGRGRGRARGADEDAGTEVELEARAGTSGSDEEPLGEERSVEGTIELLANGSGFLRVSPPEPSDEDVYVSAAQVRRCELVSGDVVVGPMRPPRRSERFPSLVRVDTINGVAAEEVSVGTRYEDLPASFPTERLALGGDDATIKAIEWLTPFGKGSRVVIVGEAHAGKTEALRGIVATLAQRGGVELALVLAGARPEEIAEWETGPVTPVAAATFATSADVQAQAVERAVEEGRRIAARGGDAVVAIDSLDGLLPAAARRAMAAARNIADGGSLTVIATATRPVGGETTVIALDARLTRMRRFPAIDLTASSTMRPELLVGEAGAQAIAQARAEAADRALR